MMMIIIVVVVVIISIIITTVITIFKLFLGHPVLTSALACIKTLASLRQAYKCCQK